MAPMPIPAPHMALAHPLVLPRAELTAGPEVTGWSLQPPSVSQCSHDPPTLALTLSPTPLSGLNSTEETAAGKLGKLE